MKTTHLQEKRSALTLKREKLIGQFNEAARAGKSTTRLCRDIRRVNDFLRTLDCIVAENTRTSADPKRYMISSLFLYESYKKLTADKDEQFFFVTGSEIDGVHVLDQWAEFAHNRRTRMGVVADFPSTHNVLIKLEQFGHKFLAHFHSHPGEGPAATHPSGIDENFQRRLESAGHVAVMGIFSRDGFIRFVRLDNNFEIQIYGQGVDRHGASVFRLTNIN